MSNLVYPALPGQAWPVARSAIWSNVVKSTDSGRDFSRANWSSPRYQYKLQYDVLREAQGYSEMQVLLDFFNRHRGNFESWLFNDPSDNTATAQTFGVGDGVTTQFQLIRALASGYVDPVYELNGAPTIYLTNWAGTKALSTTARSNKLLYSQVASNGAWSKTACTVTDNAVNAPDGTATADLLTGSGSGQRITQDFTATQAAVLTFSMYVSTPALASGVTLLLYNQSHSVALTGAKFVMGAGGGAVSSATVSSGAGTCGYEQVASSPSWWRVWIKLDASEVPAIADVVRCYLYTDSQSGAGRTGTGDASSIYAWGAQLEYSSAPTAYLPTTSAVYSQVDYTIGTSGLITTAVAPAAGASLSWSGQFYWRCRFLKSQLDFAQFMKQLHEAKSVDFITVKP